MKILMVIAALLFLSSCMTPEEMEMARRQQQLQHEQMIAARNQLNDQKCHDYGFKTGSNDYANCRLQLDLEQKREEHDKELLRSYEQQNELYYDEPLSFPMPCRQNIYGRVVC